MSETNDLFPLFVKLSQVNTLLVGGGKVGLEKATALLTNDPAAVLTIVAREACAELKAFIQAFPQVVLEERPFRLTDLDGRGLVICATGNPPLNDEIRAATRERHLLLNIADTPDLCDFYLSSVVRKGHLKIAISTNGKSPTLAKRLRELFTEILPDDMDGLLEHLHTLRDKMKGDLPEKIRRLDQLTRMLLEDLP
ncbi:precorrin-2 dehydrogenase/sirohydrochlorin ferrochelatase family protein [Dinghuibacter silviterrae]|uniref:precorrin-2 dehydrogenase n=1 Tax=Dinghuibacter silviterrae TaxID=1539049 RepID=A0A4R8DPY2_9BACT|nr:bifunctional precorrin-2 dehydrogenase/sirohydrochlorin ferrochelatase [Dinghuibacter silviterrae]TDW99356.1 precorrin-2 dehydrogenase/sirohydrochlorin ferrochelatase [Dinghuibacter silviterrae]